MSFAQPTTAGGPVRRAAVPLAPMLDVLFLLLIFFATTSTFRTAEQQIDVELPAAQTGTEPQTAGGRTLVNVRADGSVEVFGRDVTVGQLNQMLSRIVADTPDERVFVAGDQGVVYGRVMEVVDAIRGAGVDRVHFAVQPADAE